MWRGCKERNKVGLQGIKRNRNSIGGVDILVHTIFNSVLDWSERSVSCSGRFIPNKGAPLSTEQEITWAARQRKYSGAHERNSQTCTPKCGAGERWRS
jgi:hypothetical protein